MKLNILTTRTGNTADIPLKIKEIDFWRHYLHFLNLRSSFFIQQKELEVFSWILSQEPEVSWFSKPNSDRMKDAISKLSSPEITRIRSRLLELNLVEQHKDPEDGRKTVTLPVPGLVKLQKFIKNNKNLTIVFSYEITQ